MKLIKKIKGKKKKGKERRKAGRIEFHTLYFAVASPLAPIMQIPTAPACPAPALPPV